MMRRVDLLPESYRLRHRQRRNLALIVGAGVVVLLLMILWWVVLGMRVNDQRDRLEQAQARNAQLQQRIDRLQSFAQLESEVQAKQAALKTVMAGDVDWPALLTEVAMVVPGEVWLDSLTASAGDTEGSAPVGTETNPIRLSKQQPFGRISFSGSSLSMPGVAKWLIRLQSVDDFQAVWLESAGAGQQSASTSVVQFSNTVELNGKAASRRFQRQGEP
jgi:Tfp pilus assembly protein PilN